MPIWLDILRRPDPYAPILALGHRQATPLMNHRDESPAAGKDAFICPSCDVYAHQTWHRTELRAVPASAVEHTSQLGIVLEQLAFNLQALTQQGVATYVTAASSVFVSCCDRCHELALWLGDRCLWPRSGTAPPASRELPGEVRRLYDEADLIAEDSPRGAAALLRLAAEMLCRTVLPQKAPLNDQIAELVAQGIDEETQKALDAVRIFGNRAVHTDVWADSTDGARVVATLFRVVNRIAESLAQRPSEAEQLYRALPFEERAKVERRNKQARRRRR